MNCANCRGRLFFFGDNEELFPGSEIVFCYACRKKITSFLEERNTFATHAAHLNARRRELEVSGVTPAGLSALAAYCAYLDRIAPRKQEVAAPPKRVQVPEPVEKQAEPAELHDETLELTERVDALTGRMKLLTWLAGIGSLTGVGSLIAVICMLLAN